MNYKYIFLVCAHNCEQYIITCLQSLFDQRYDDFGVIVVDDASTDTTASVIKEFGKDKENFIVDVNDKRTGSAAWNQYKAVKKYVTNPESIICIVDGDDYLTDPLSLNRLDRHIHSSVFAGFTGYTDPLNICNKLGHTDMRKKNGPYHMRFFRAFLYDAVPEEMYYRDGELIQAASDYAFIYPLIDLLGEKRIAMFLHPMMYYWRNNIDTNDHSMNYEEQKSNAVYIFNRERLEELSDEQLRQLSDNYPR
tara:strand:- start:560 stop:1309 length:750 start_codon:yes stop_codon:yes gene_type:complete